MIVDGKVIVQDADGTRYVFVGVSANVYVGKRSKLPFLELYDKSTGVRFRLRKICRDPNGRKFKP